MADFTLTVLSHKHMLHTSKRWYRGLAIEITQHYNNRELLHHGRRAGQEEMTEIQVVSGKTNLILHIETYQL